MAKRPAKRLEDQIAELEAVVDSLHTCSKCGKPIEPDQAACPHCGAIVGEDMDLPTEASKPRPEPQGAAAPRTKAPPSPEPGASPPPEPVKPPAVPVEAPAAPVAPATSAPEPEPEPSPEPEPQEEAFEPGPQEAETLEPEVLEARKEEEAAAVETRPPVRRERERARPRGKTGPGFSPKLPLVAGGAVLYFVALLAFLPFFGRYVSASTMVLASVIVVAGIVWREAEAPKPPAPRKAVRSDFVCPLCGTEVPPDATKCATCGAEFED
jgi:DNA-directed RNA polymerase subunit RPC12/RpoP